MKKSLRFISLFIAAIFLISGAMMVVCHAEPEGGGESGGSGAVDVNPGGGESGGNTGGGGESGGGNTGGGGESGGSDTGGDTSGGNTGGGNTGGGTGTDTGYNAGDSGNNSGYDSGYDSDYNSGNSGNYSYQVEDSDPIYYGDSSQYGHNLNDGTGEQAAGSVSSNTTLYNSSGMSAADAAPNEWSEITLDEKTVKTGVTDFSSIKENTEVEDNGGWILYVGYALLGLAGLGILYFIIATIAHRNAVRKAERAEQRRRQPHASHSAAARMDRMDERERSESEPYSRRTSRFADDDAGYSRRGSSRSDTDEVYVPRRAAAKRSR